MAYLPSDFWRVAFAIKGSAIPVTLERSLGLLVVPAGAAALAHFDVVENQVPSSVITPFGILVGLMISFRLNNAYGKWEKGSKCIVDLHSTTRLLVSRLCAIFEPTPENVKSIEKVRRLLVLGCLSIKKHLRRTKTFETELETGLITREEHALLGKVRPRVSCPRLACAN